MTNKFILVILVIFNYMPSLPAQNSNKDIVIGKEFTVHSKILNEDRSYYVHLPDSYGKTDKNYPVIYLLDGEQNFILTVGIVSKMHTYSKNPLQDVIIVGIPNTDRTRDYTPTPSISKKGHATLENSGGGDNFLSFIQKELIPSIDKKYSTSERKILIGHSFGGLLTMYALLNRSDMFTDYLALDPSFWWDNQHLLKTVAPLLKSVNLEGKKLFIGQSGEIPSKLHDKQLTFTGIMESTNTDLVWTYQNFKDETHGSIFTKGVINGLQVLFKEKNREQ